MFRASELVQLELQMIKTTYCRQITVWISEGISHHSGYIYLRQGGNEIVVLRLSAC